MTEEELRQLSRANRKRYEHDYGPQMLISLDHNDPYFSRLTQARLDLLDKIVAHNDLLDIGCGLGAYLIEVRRKIRRGVGLDFSTVAVSEAVRYADREDCKHLSFVQGDVLNLPFTSASFDAVFSEATLVCVPCPERALSEISRVLRPGGKAVIGMGNSWSLNHWVCQSHPETARTYHVPFWRMPGMLRAAGLTVEEVRSFQVLPYWGEKPWWLRPLLRKGWRKLMSREWSGRMIDEQLASSFLLRPFCFRHLWLCRKEPLR